MNIARFAEHLQKCPKYKNWLTSDHEEEIDPQADNEDAPIDAASLDETRVQSEREVSSGTWTQISASRTSSSTRRTFSI